MSPFFTFIFERLTDPLTFPIHPFMEYVILLILGRIAFNVAWKVSSGGFSGSTIHWFVRLIAFVMIWVITYAIIVVGQFIVAHWILILHVICFSAIASISVIMIINDKNRKYKIK